VRSRSEERAQLPLSQAGWFGAGHVDDEHHAAQDTLSLFEPTCAGSRSKAPICMPSGVLRLQNICNPAKAVAAMKACALHLRDRTPNRCCARVSGEAPAAPVFAAACALVLIYITTRLQERSGGQWRSGLRERPGRLSSSAPLSGRSKCCRECVLTLENVARISRGDF